MSEDRVYDGAVDENFGAGKTEDEQKAENGALEASRREVFETTPQPFFVKIAD